MYSLLQFSKLTNIPTPVLKNLEKEKKLIPIISKPNKRRKYSEEQLSFVKNNNILDYICPLCNKTYDSQRALDTHYGRSHKEYYEKIKKDKIIEKQKDFSFSCPYCYQKFKDRVSLFKHTNFTHKIKSIQTILLIDYNNIVPLCKCGCGKETSYDSTLLKFSEYLKGHIARVNNNYNTDKSKKNSKKTRQINTTLGKYKGIPKSEEHKRKIRETHQRLKLSPEELKRRTLYLKSQQMTNSGLEVKFAKILDELNILYERQFFITKKMYDFKIENTNILIEVDGDYWHCNPVKYPNGPKYRMQKENIIRDQLKNQLAKDNGYNLLRFWETDVLHNQKNIIETLRKEILI